MFDLGHVIFAPQGSSFLICKTGMTVPTLQSCCEGSIEQQKDHWFGMQWALNVCSLLRPEMVFLPILPSMEDNSLYTVGAQQTLTKVCHEATPLRTNNPIYGGFPVS